MADQGDDFSKRLAELDSRVRQVRVESGFVTKAAGERKRRDSRGVALAFRLAFELVVGTGLGAAIGFWADDLLGSAPWGMVVGLLFGAASGFLNVYRIIKGFDILDIQIPGAPKGNDTTKNTSDHG